MLKKIFTTACCMALLFGAYAQRTEPRWLYSNYIKVDFPEDRYITTTALSENCRGKSKAVATDLAIKKAKAALREAIYHLTESGIVNVKTQGSKPSSFQQHAMERQQDYSFAEITGEKVETYYDRDENVVYVFAYVSRLDLIKYHKNAIALNIGKVESVVKLAAELERMDNKTKAQEEYNKSQPLLEQIEKSQEQLIKVDKNVTEYDLQKAKVAELRNKVIHSLERLKNIQTYYFASYRLSLTAPFGVSLGACKRWGGYMQLSWNMAKVKEGKLIEAYEGEGKRSYFRRSLTAGGMVRPVRSWDFLYLYAGAGYGKYGATYVTSNTHYCPDLIKGLEVEGGVTFAYKFLNASLGYSTIVGTQFRELHFGLGVRF